MLLQLQVCVAAIVHVVVDSVVCCAAVISAAVVINGAAVVIVAAFAVISVAYCNHINIGKCSSPLQLVI